MNWIALLTTCLLTISASAQTVLTGRITDLKGHSLPGANVMLHGTYDGTSTDSTGAFRFSTSRKDTATLVVSYIGYEPTRQKITISPNPISIRLNELANELNTVVVTAGVFEASDSKRMTMLKPMDIVTTAGGGADITSVMNLLPGAQRVGEQNGLFVRGGSGEEAKIVIDGMIVQNPFFSQSPNLQSRGRFQPFMFKGTSFSTGGYSAQYGQALSSVLLLNTTDQNQNEGLGISVNLANAGLTYDHATRNASISATGYYGNLKPLFALVPQNIDWTHVPELGGGSLTYRLQPSRTGMLKFYGMYSNSVVGMNFIDPSSEMGKTAFNQRNNNTFVTSTYTDSWANGAWQLMAGLSYSHDIDATTYGTLDFGRGTDRLQGRAMLTRSLGGKLGNQLLFGSEGSRVTYQNSIAGTPYSLVDTYGAVFFESQVYAGRKLAIQSGIRGEYSSVLNRFNLAPRISMAYKTGIYSQVSLAYGQFYQTPDARYLYRNTSLNYERADHLILNYQIIRNKRTFRIETYYKNYAQLVREFTGPNGTLGSYDANPYRFPWGQTDNTGYGYAKGFDLFWRDQQTIKGLDYWITYSFVDSKRLFQQFPTLATPSFISNHNIALIGKRYFEKISTNMGLTYTISTGRPYYNPTNSTFLADRTPAVTNLSFSASHLTHIGKNLTILYASVDNILNTRNVYTYLYTPNRNDGSQPTRYAVGPASYRSFFVGGIVMLSRKAKVDVRQL